MLRWTTTRRTTEQELAGHSEAKRRLGYRYRVLLALRAPLKIARLHDIDRGQMLYRSA